LNKRRLSILVLMVLFFLNGMFFIGKQGKVKAQGTEFFVSPTGSGIDCSQSNPCSVSRAMDEARSGEKIYFAEGVYNESGGVPSKFVLYYAATLIGGWDGSPTGPVVVDPVTFPTTLTAETGKRIIKISVYGQDDFTTTVTGIRFLYGNITDDATGNNGGAIAIVYGKVLIEDNVFQDNYAAGNGGAIYVAAHRDVIIRNNELMSNTSGLLGGAIYIEPSSPVGTGQVLIEGNDFYHGNSNYGSAVAVVNVPAEISRNRMSETNGDRTIHIDSDGPASVVTNNIIAWAEEDAVGVAGTSTTPHQFINNTIVHSGVNGIVGYTGSKIYYVNNIIAHTYLDSILAHGDPSTGSHNLFYENGRDLVLLDNPITGMDPDFVDPLNDNYHINEGSPAQNAGAIVALTRDIDNEPRPSGEGYDIGADEILEVIYYIFPIFFH